MKLDARRSAMRRIAMPVGTLVVALIVASCSSGGNDDPPPPPPPPAAPSALSYPAAPAFRVGTAISQLTPSVTGSVTSFAVAPALPAGLALNAGSGAISGTPTAVAATANYIVTASNAGGSTTASLSLTVNDAAPDIAYGAATHVFTTDVRVTLTPTTTGGAVTQWSIDHPLPAGLALNASTGVISGNPTTISAASPYVVTATNSGGTDTFTLNIAVQNGVLLDLGHVAEIQALRISGSRIVSLDLSAHIALWNAQTGAEIASVDSTCTNTCGDVIALAGPTAVFAQPTGLDVRSSADGAPLAMITLPSTLQTWWKLAADGSYISAGTTTSVTVWAPNGAVLFSRNGDYSSARPFAAAGELRLAGGPAGANVLEKISLPGGGTTTVTFQGQFNSWFVDGERFLTNVGNAVWVYSREAVQQDLVALTTVSGLAGQGDWFWTVDPTNLRIFRVGASTAPAASYPMFSISKVIPTGGVLALLSSSSIGIVDFASGAPVRTDYASPIDRTSAFAANSATDWVYGNRDGLLLGDLTGPGAPTRYSLGKVLSIAASNSRIAVAIVDGSILYFDVATRLPQGEIAALASKLAMSADGTRLAATQVGLQSPRSMRVYELPSETILAEWLFPGTAQNLHDTTMSLSGTFVGQVTTKTSVVGISRDVLNIDGTPVWSDTATYQEPSALLFLGIHLSPDGSLIAVSSGDFFGTPTPTTSTNIYTGATLTTAVTGLAVGWIDGSRLLVNRYILYPRMNTAIYDRCEFVTSAGQVSACPTLPELRTFQPVTANSIYSAKFNTIYDLTTGASLWTSAAPTRGEGAVAGNNVVFTSGATVRIEPR